MNPTAKLFLILGPIAVDPDFRTTGLSGICVLKMVRKEQSTYDRK